MQKNLFDQRREYAYEKIDFFDLKANPFDMFDDWFDTALKTETEIEANAFTLSTVHNGQPESRILLLKFYDRKGFRFFTNYDSQKGRSMKENPLVGMNFFWPNTERQVRIQGKVERLTNRENDHYFAERPRESRAGAILSNQSQALPLDFDFEQAMVDLLHKDHELKRPDNWGGYLVEPHLVEFWQGRPGRLHDRLRYTKNGSRWGYERLAP